MTGRYLTVVLFLVLAVCAKGLDGKSPSSLYMESAVAAQMESAGYVIAVYPEPAPTPARTRKGGAVAISFPTVARRQAAAAGISNPELFVRQIAAESRFDPCVTSHAGALGIAQIMPDTAKGWGVDPHDPIQALSAAARAMAKYEKQLGSYELALAAYNAGPGNVQKYGGVPPFSETEHYIAKIMGSEPLPGMDSVFTRPASLDPEFAKKITSLTRAVRARGGNLEVVSAHRTYDEQMELWIEAKGKYGGWPGAKKWVAPPGCSNHNRGTAIDLAGSLDLAGKLAPRFGLYRPMAHEPWHFEPRG